MFMIEFKSFKYDLIKFYIFLSSFKGDILKVVGRFDFF